MRVYIAILLLIFSGLVFSDPNDIIPEIKELTKVQREKYGKLGGGSSVILNSKSYELISHIFCNNSLIFMLI